MDLRSNPALDKAIQNKTKKGSHDALHNFGIYQYCWCKCSKCWLPYRTMVDGHLIGRCICHECPCNEGEFISILTMAEMKKRVPN